MHTMDEDWILDYLDLPYQGEDALSIVIKALVTEQFHVGPIDKDEYEVGWAIVMTIHDPGVPHLLASLDADAIEVILWEINL